jgi:hypothetical protein
MFWVGMLRIQAFSFMFPSCPVEAKSSFFSIFLLCGTSLSFSLLVFTKYSKAVILNLNISSMRIRNELAGIFFCSVAIYYFLEFLDFVRILPPFKIIIIGLKFLYLDFENTYKTVPEQDTLLDHTIDYKNRLFKLIILIISGFLQFVVSSARIISEFVVLSELIEYSQKYGPCLQTKRFIITGMLIAGFSGGLTSDELVRTIKYFIGDGKMCVLPPYVYLGQDGEEVGYEKSLHNLSKA